MKSLFQFYILLFSITLILNQYNTAQQDISFENISIPDGLSSNVIFCVYEDKFGILWIGTGEGINRFDGYTIKSYKNDPDDPNSLNGNQIFQIIEDYEGNLWAGGNGGLSRFDRNTEQFENFLLDSTANSPQAQQTLTIFEDSKNNLWIGSVSGTIKRFDKTKNRIINIEPKLESGEKLEIPAVATFVESEDGTLYTSFFNYGFAKFNYETEKFELLECSDPAYPIYFKNNFMLGLDIDRQGNLWTTSVKGLVAYNIESKTVRGIEMPDLSPGQNQISMFRVRVLNGNEIWLGTDGSGLYRFIPENNEITHFVQEGLNENSLQSNSVFDIQMDSFGDVWISTLGGGIAKYNVDKEPFKLIKIPDTQSGQNFKQINAIHEYSDSEVLLGTRDGLYSANMKTSDIIKKNAAEAAINSIIEYTEDEYWLGTQEGVKIYSLKKNRVLRSAIADNINSLLKPVNVRQILIDSSNNLWIVTSGTVIHFNQKDNSLKKIFSKSRKSYSDNISSRVRKIIDASVPLEGILKVGEDQLIKKKFNISKKSRLMVVSTGEGIDQPKLSDYGWITNETGDIIWNNQDFSQSFHLGGAVKNRVKIDMIEFEAGVYFLNYISDVGHSFSNWNAVAPADSNWWGIQIIETDGVSFDQLAAQISEENSSTFIDATIINRLVQTESGIIWVATNQGIVSLDPESYETKIFSSENFTNKGFVNDVIRDIVEDDDGMLWLATSGGLIRFNPAAETAISLTTGDGLPSSQIVSILEDDYGNLWMGSLNGLTKFDKSSILSQPYFVNYDVKDGLQGYFYNNGAAYKSDQGKLYFGGRNGFNSFYPGKINKIPPKIAIDGFYISNNYFTTATENSPLTKNILETTELILPFSQNDISFNFSAIHYLRPERNKLAYMMEGLDTSWVYDNRRYAAFTNLDPGEYTFKVKGANSDGIWNEDVRTIAITVLPPWYRTTLAYIFYGLALVGSLITLNRLQRKRILTKEREKQLIQEAELRAVAAEAEAKVIQAENDRKTAELEEARQLQLSMLPAELPDLPHLDIAVYMKTATEVGGDYYDFHIGMDGTLTCVIGDATGHGLNAGTMVTATKSLFSTHAANPDILFTFQEISRCLKGMRMRLLSMCLMMAKIKGNELTISTAGMPPALLYRHDNKIVEELLIKGMPLGAPASIPYEVKKTTLYPGDTLLLLSDGFPELFNTRKEMYGYDRVIKTFNKFAHKEAAEIIDSLQKEGSDYVEGRDPDDDVTFVVIKVKEN